MIDLAAGRISLATAPLLAAMGQVTTGKLRVIAILGPNRSKLLPDIPTTQELKYDVDYPSWSGIFAPPRTPQAIVDKINAGFVVAIKAPDNAAALEKTGTLVVGSSQADFSRKFISEMAAARKIIETNKITMEQ